MQKIPASSFAAVRARFQTLLALIFAFVFTSSVFAQHEDPKNAAPYYTSAIENLPAFTDEQWALIIDIDPNKDFDPIRPILSRAFRSIDSAMRGSRLPYCDFDLDYSQGLELLLPHLGPLRNVARLMHAQALLQLHDNNPSAASATIAAMYRMANHLSADRTLISSLVAAAIFSLADSTSQAAFDRMLFSASDSATLYGAVSSIPAHDPFAFGEAIAMEQSTLVDEFDRHFTQDEIPADFLQSIQDPDTPPNPLITQIAEEGSFDQELQRYDEFMTKVVSAFTNPDDEQAAAQLAELEKSCAAGDAGLLAQLLSPAFSRVHQMMLKNQASLADRLAMLKNQMEGAEPPIQAANAALWYLRAIDQLSKLSADQLSLIRTTASHPADIPSPDLAVALNAAQPALDTLREAAHITRCNFPAILGEPDFFERPLTAPYLPGMLDCHSLALASAIAALNRPSKNPPQDSSKLSEDSPAYATRDLAVSLQISAHLGTDTSTLSPIIAHHLFNTSIAALQDEKFAPLLAVDRRPPLFDIIQHISRKDPFNYITVITSARQAAARFPAKLNPPTAPSQQDAVNAAAESIRTLDPDHLLSLLTFCELLARPPSTEKAGQQPIPASSPAESATAAHTNSSATPSADPSANLQPPPVPSTPDSLHDFLLPFASFLSLDNLERLHNQLPAIAPLLAQYNWSVFAETALPPIADVNTLMNQSRADLRRAILLLEPPQPTRENSNTRAATHPD